MNSNQRTTRTEQTGKRKKKSFIWFRRWSCDIIRQHPFFLTSWRSLHIGRRALLTSITATLLTSFAALVSGELGDIVSKAGEALAFLQTGPPSWYHPRSLFPQISGHTQSFHIHRGHSGLRVSPRAREPHVAGRWFQWFLELGSCSSELTQVRTAAVVGVSR